MSPPVRNAASPGNRESGPGSPRGKKFEDHRPERERPRNSWRVMTSSTASFDEGDVISSRLRCALRAPNGRVIPMAEEELNLWFKSFYGLAENRRNEPIAIVRDRTLHGMWSGTVVGDVYLQRGDWFIIRSDESQTKITQMHTMPLANIIFTTNDAKKIVATYPKEKNNPSAVARFADSDSTGVYTETPIQ